MIKINMQKLIDACPDPACDVNVTIKTSEVWIEWTWFIEGHGNLTLRRVINLREIGLSKCDLVDLELEWAAEEMNEMHRGFISSIKWREQNQ